MGFEDLILDNLGTFDMKIGILKTESGLTGPLSGIFICKISSKVITRAMWTASERTVKPLSGLRTTKARFLFLEVYK